MSNTNTFMDKLKTGLGKTGNVLGLICTWIYRLRHMFMAAPVVYGAIVLAIRNSRELPESVGLNLQSNGEFALLVTRNYAVFGPLLVTAFCLLLMFCSKKAWYPWIISIFTLVIPLLIYVINVYAA